MLYETLAILALGLQQSPPEAPPQGPGDLETVLAHQQRRIAVMERVAPSVCSVMKMDSPGGGSGVIFDPAGFVLTNYHVVGEPSASAGDGPKPEGDGDGDGSDNPLEDLLPDLDDLPIPDDLKKKIKPGSESAGGKVYAPMKIGLPDGNLYTGKVLGIDPGSDLAVIWLGPREDGEPWPYTPLGDSDDLLVGEPVFAMGNPFLLATDFSPTVTWGIVSGTHRYQGGQGNRMLVYPDCIQVDAPINPGNSGGPLFSEKGEVVGINGRIQLRDRGRVNTGVGFAIAANQIRNFLGDMMAGRHTEHGTLDLNAYFMNSRGEHKRGVFVQAVFADSRARALGVDLGDELVRFNGEEIRSANQLATMVGVLPEGAWVTLDYRPLRNGEFESLQSIVLRLNRLDTGSSARESWIATDEIRGAARAALTRHLGEEADPGHAVVTTARKDGRTLVRTRLGVRLRIDVDDAKSLVRTAPGEGFKIVQGRALDLTPEEQALLDREMACNAALFAGAGRRELLATTLLYGGEFIHGRPAFAYEVPGEQTLRFYLYEDGKIAGWHFRDTLDLEELEYRVPHPDVVARAEALATEDDTIAIPGLRVLRENGDMELGGSIAIDRTTVPSADLFERPDA